MILCDCDLCSLLRFVSKEKDLQDITLFQFLAINHLCECLAKKYKEVDE